MKNEISKNPRKLMKEVSVVAVSSELSGDEKVSKLKVKPVDCNEPVDDKFACFVTVDGKISAEVPENLDTCIGLVIRQVPCHHQQNPCYLVMGIQIEVCVYFLSLIEQKEAFLGALKDWEIISGRLKAVEKSLQNLRDAFLKEKRQEDVQSIPSMKCTYWTADYEDYGKVFTYVPSIKFKKSYGVQDGFLATALPFFVVEENNGKLFWQDFAL